MNNSMGGNMPQRPEGSQNSMDSKKFKNASKFQGGDQKNVGNFGGNMQRPDTGDNTNTPPDKSTQKNYASVQSNGSFNNWVWIIVSTGVLLIGIGFACLYKRRKK